MNGYQPAYSRFNTSDAEKRVAEFRAEMHRRHYEHMRMQRRMALVSLAAWGFASACVIILLALI